ncbi:MAG: hypothetical protein GX802_00140 [Clostridiales bacterium]|nr:hypothetical protein [Clostridiales bacterium]
MENVYCTVLSSLRLFQAIVLLSSMYQNIGDFVLYILCIDDEVYSLLHNLNPKCVETICIEDLKQAHLSKHKKKLDFSEFCWMLKPLLIEYLLVEHPTVRRVTYIDSDLFFWSDPTIVFTAQPDSSVLLSSGEVNMPLFPKPLIDSVQEVTGKYNSGFISFSNNEESRKCVKWWKGKCLESCKNAPWDDEFGDQKYLDEMPALFNGVSEITTSGVNIGHWNNSNFEYNMHDNQLFVDEEKLICYHFSGFRVFDRESIFPIYESNRIELPFFYSIYIMMLREAVDMIAEYYPDFDGFATEDDVITLAKIQDRRKIYESEHCNTFI